MRLFYPALEPRQSIKLRGVLFQLLNQLKSDGVLPRECTLRKTMLDDCVGERFEELLFFFSSIVLRKALDAQHITTSTAASYSLGMATCLEAEEIATMEPLALTLNRSLQTALLERQQRRSSITGLVRTLRTKENALRSRHIKADDSLVSSRNMLTSIDIDIEATKQQLREEHTGDEDWLELGLGGDTEHGRDLLVEEDFERLWVPTITAQPLPHSEPTRGLLADLDFRIEAQKSRLQGWKAFQAEVSRRNEGFVVSSPIKSPLRSPMRSPGKFHTPQQALTPVTKSSRKVPRATPILAPPRHKALRLPSSPQRRPPVSNSAIHPHPSTNHIDMEPIPLRLSIELPVIDTTPVAIENDDATAIPEVQRVSHTIVAEDMEAAQINVGHVEQEPPLTNRPQTPTESLFAEDADPSSVFKTRSKLRRTFSKSPYDRSILI